MDWSVPFNNWQRQNTYSKNPVDANNDGKIDNNDLRHLKNEEKEIYSKDNLDLNDDGNFDYKDLIQLGKDISEITDLDGDGSLGDEEKSFLEFVRKTFTTKLSKDINSNTDLNVSDMLNLEKDIRDLWNDATLTDEVKKEISEDLEKIQNRMVSNLTEQIFVTNESDSYKAKAEANAKAIWNAEAELNVMNAKNDNPFNDKLENLLEKLEGKVESTLAETMTPVQISKMKSQILVSSGNSGSSEDVSTISDEDLLSLTDAILTLETNYYNAITNATKEDDEAAQTEYEEANEKISAQRSAWEKEAKKLMDADDLAALTEDYNKKKISLDEYNFKYVKLEVEAMQKYIANRQPVDSTKNAVMTDKNGIIYKNGNPYTGLYENICYINGSKVDKTVYKNKYYENGVVLTGESYDGFKYVDGAKFNGVDSESKKLYVEGKILTGVYEKDGKYYDDGEVKARVFGKDGKLYISGYTLYGIDEETGMCYKDGDPSTQFYNSQYYEDGVAKNAPQYIIDFAKESLHISDGDIETLVATSETKFTVMQMENDQYQQITYSDIVWKDEDKTDVTSYNRTCHLVSDVIQVDSFTDDLKTGTKLVLVGDTEAQNTPINLDIDGAKTSDAIDIKATIPVADGVTLSVTIYEAITDGMTRARTYQKVDGKYELAKEEVQVGSIKDIEAATTVKTYQVTPNVTYERILDEDETVIGVAIKDTSLDGVNIETQYSVDGELQGTDIKFPNDTTVGLAATDDWSVNGNTVTVMFVGFVEMIKTFDAEGTELLTISSLESPELIQSMKDLANELGLSVTKLQDVVSAEGVITSVTLDGTKYSVEVKDGFTVLTSEDGNITRTFKDKIERENVTIVDGIKTTTIRNEKGKVTDIKTEAIDGEFVLSEAKPVIVEKSFEYDEDNNIISYTIKTNAFDIDAPTLSNTELNKLTSSIKSITNNYCNSLTNSYKQFVYTLDGSEIEQREDFSYASLKSGKYLQGEYRLVNSKGEVIYSSANETSVKTGAYKVDTNLKNMTYFQAKVFEEETTKSSDFVYASLKDSKFVGTDSYRLCNADGKIVVASDAEKLNDDYIVDTKLKEREYFQDAIKNNTNGYKLQKLTGEEWNDVALSALTTVVEVDYTEDDAKAKEIYDAALANKTLKFTYQDGEETKTENLVYESLANANFKNDVSYRLYDAKTNKIVVAAESEIPEGEADKYTVDAKLTGREYFQDIIKNATKYSLQKYTAGEGEAEGTWGNIVLADLTNVSEVKYTEDDEAAREKYLAALENKNLKFEYIVDDGYTIQKKSADGTWTDYDIAACQDLKDYVNTADDKEATKTYRTELNKLGADKVAYWTNIANMFITDAELKAIDDAAKALKADEEATAKAEYDAALANKTYLFTYKKADNTDVTEDFTYYSLVSAKDLVGISYRLCDVDGKIVVAELPEGANADDYTIDEKITKGHHFQDAVRKHDYTIQQYVIAEGETEGTWTDVNVSDISAISEVNYTEDDAIAEFAYAEKINNIETARLAYKTRQVAELQAQKITDYLNEDKVQVEVKTENIENGTKETKTIIDKSNGNKIIYKQEKIKDAKGKETQMITYAADGTTVKETQLYTYNQNGDIATATVYTGAYVEDAETNVQKELVEYTYDEDNDFLYSTIKSFADGKVVSQTKTDKNNNVIEVISYDDSENVSQTTINTYDKNGFITTKKTYIGEYKDNDNKISSIVSYDEYEMIKSTEKYSYYNGKLQRVETFDENNIMAKRATYDAEGKKVEKTEVWTVEKDSDFKVELKTVTTYVGEYVENSKTNKIQERVVYGQDESTVYKTEKYTYNADGSYKVVTTFNNDPVTGKRLEKPLVYESEHDAEGTITDKDIENFAKKLGITDLEIAREGSFTGSRFGYDVEYSNFSIVDGKYSYTEVVKMATETNALTKVTTPVVELVTTVENGAIKGDTYVRFNGSDKDEDKVVVNVNTLTAKNNNIADQIQIGSSANSITIMDCQTGSNTSGIIRTISKSTEDDSITTKYYMGASFGTVKNATTTGPVITFDGIPECKGTTTTQQVQKPEAYLQYLSDSTTYTATTSALTFTDIDEIEKITYEYPVGTKHEIEMDSEDKFVIQTVNHGKYADTEYSVNSYKNIPVEVNVSDANKTAIPQTLTMVKTYSLLTGVVASTKIALPNGSFLKVDDDAEYTYIPSTEKQDEVKDGVIILGGTISAKTTYSESAYKESIYDMEGNQKSSVLKIKDTEYMIGTNDETGEDIAVSTTKDGDGKTATIKLYSRINATINDTVVKANAYSEIVFDKDGNQTNNSIYFPSTQKTVYVPVNSEIEIMDNKTNDIKVKSAEGVVPSYELVFANQAQTQANLNCKVGEVISGTITANGNTLKLQPTATVSFYGDYIFVIDISGTNTVYKNDLTEVKDTFFSKLTSGYATMFEVLNNQKALTGEYLKIEDYSSISLASGKVILSKTDKDDDTVESMLSISYTQSKNTATGKTENIVTGYSISTAIEGSDKVYRTDNYEGSSLKSSEIAFMSNGSLVNPIEMDSDENAVITIDNDKKQLLVTVEVKDADTEDEEAEVLYSRISKYDIEKQSLTETVIKIGDKEFGIPKGAEFTVSEDKKTLVSTLNINGNKNNVLTVNYSLEDETATPVYTLKIGTETFEDISCDIKDINITTGAIYIYDGTTEIEYDLVTALSYEHNLADLKALVESKNNIELPKNAKVEVTNKEIKITTDENPKYELCYAITKTTAAYTIGALTSGKVSNNTTTRVFAASSTLSYYGNAVIVENGTTVSIFDCANNLNQVDDNDALKSFSSVLVQIIDVLKEVEEKSSKNGEDQGEIVDLDKVTKITVDSASNSTTIISEDKVLVIYLDANDHVDSYAVSSKSAADNTYVTTISDNARIETVYSSDSANVLASELKIAGKTYSVPQGATWKIDNETNTLTLTKTISSTTTITMKFSTVDGSNKKADNVLTVGSSTTTFECPQGQNMAVTSTHLYIYNDNNESIISLSNLDSKTYTYSYNKTVSDLMEMLDIDYKSTTIKASTIKSALISKYNSLTAADYEYKAILRHFVTLNNSGVAIDADGARFKEFFTYANETDVVTKSILNTSGFEAPIVVENPPVVEDPEEDEEPEA